MSSKVHHSKRIRTLFVLALATYAAPTFAQDEDEDEPSVGSSSASAPAAAEDDDEAPAMSAKKRKAAGAGMAADDTLVAGAAAGIVETDEGGEWAFNFKGFFRAPMRIGFGEYGDSLQLHAPPVIPDGNYTNWQYTNSNPSPWVEMLFQYGNNRVKMTTSIASYNITSGGFRELQAQLGIDRAFLTLSFPDALNDYGGLTWNVGVFYDRYGAAGRYDAGMYETYLFGRTRMAGETLTGNVYLGDDFVLLFEHGIGSKLDQQLWTQRANSGDPTVFYQSYEPYPGPRQQGTTLLHHAHAGIRYQELLTATLHYLYTWTKDARATAGDKDGSITVMGADLKLIGGYLGNGYIGFSHINAKNAMVVSDAIEVLHSQGGWQLANNYFGNGYGTMNTVLFQYQFSLAAFMLRPQPWWGDGADLVATVFGMFNSIDTDVTPANGSGDKKLKWGGDVTYVPLPFLGFGARVDLVHPDLDDSKRSFAVISPRLVFKTNFVTHEQIVVQYSHYSTNERTLLPHPFGGAGAVPPFRTSTADKGVLSISASMWW